MKLIELITHLVEPNKLKEFYRVKGLNSNSEALLIYLQGALDLDSQLSILEIEETNDSLVFEKAGITYFQLFPIDFAAELIESDLELKIKGKTDLEIAVRLLEYRLKEA